MNALTRILRHTDLLVGLGLLLVVAMLLMPMPHWALDTGLVLAMCISVVILLMAVNVKDPVEFSAFPSVLLITTLFRLALSIAATTTLQVDFKSGETDLLGNAVNLQSVKLVAVVVTTASATLWVGPQNLTNACQLWFGGVGSTDKAKVTDRFWNSDAGGWAVGSSTKILGINNPGGSTVSGYLICAGVAA